MTSSINRRRFLESLAALAAVAGARDVVGAVYRVIRAFLPAMLEAGGGAIVNMSSIASALRGVPNHFVYTTTKAAVLGPTKGVAADFVGRGIR